MGAFHEGHLDLMRRAGADGYAVVVTLFVNPTQFAADRGPRRATRATRPATWPSRPRRGVDLVFAPDA